MANPNGLLRPPVLNVTEQAAQENAPNTVNVSLEELTPIIAQIASQIVKQQTPVIVQAALNPNAHLQVVVDQEIAEQHRGRLEDLDKIPDIVKYLREFSGVSGEFNSWKKSVERVLQIYESTRGTPRYYGILSVIRSKVTGDADIALESYNTPLDWNAISRCLTLHYADKRDLSTLEYQMSSLVQGRLSVQEYYQQVYRHLSLILNKLGCLDTTNESLTLLTQTYREKALDTFIRGLNGDLPRLLGVREPLDLPQALHLCLKLENQTYRANYAQNHFPNLRKPPLPPRKYPQNSQSSNNFRPNNLPHNLPQGQQIPFHPEISYPPQGPYLSPRPSNAHQNHYTNNFRNNQDNTLPYPRNQSQILGQPQFVNQQQVSQPQIFQPQFNPRPIIPQAAPEPMDVDRSIRTGQINYINRPRFNNRPPTTVNQPQPKIQKTFYVDTEVNSYNNDMLEQYNQFGQSLEEYIAPHDESVIDEVDSDFNFLGM